MRFISTLISLAVIGQMPLTLPSYWSSACDIDVLPTNQIDTSNFIMTSNKLKISNNFNHRYTIYMMHIINLLRLRSNSLINMSILINIIMMQACGHVACVCVFVDIFFAEFYRG